jgi:vacuolar protein sorting-associated protein 29
MLAPNKMQHVICTGNIGREQYNELCALAPNVHVVSGDYDEDDMGFAETRVVQVGQFRIGIMHGHQILPYNSQESKARMRRKLNVDIFVSGHSHQNEVVLQDGYYHINPVSRLAF